MNTLGRVPQRSWSMLHNNSLHVHQGHPVIIARLLLEGAAQLYIPVTFIYFIHKVKFNRKYSWKDSILFRDDVKINTCH